MTRLEVVAASDQTPDTWAMLRASAEQAARDEPLLASQLNAVILAHADLAAALHPGEPERTP